jgi:ABC transporter
LPGALRQDARIGDRVRAQASPVADRRGERRRGRAPRRRQARRRRSQPEAGEHALRWLDWVGLGKQANRPAAYLSGGEQRRVALARALAPAPALLVADEPTAHLDQLLGRMVIRLLHDTVREHGTTVIAASHERAPREPSNAMLRIVAAGALTAIAAAAFLAIARPWHWSTTGRPSTAARDGKRLARITPAAPPVRSEAFDPIGLVRTALAAADSESAPIVT